MKIKKSFLPLFLVQIFLLFVGARLWNLSKYGLWSDEVFSLQTAKLSWTSLFDRVIYDVVHPPLFYVLLKIWITIGGDSLTWLKILPVFFATSALIPLYFLCRELKISLTEFSLALTFIALNSYLIFFAQELRMYSLLAALSVWSMWLFVRFLNENASLRQVEWSLFFVNLLLVYTHYFGWFTILAELAFAFFWQRKKFKRFSVQIFVAGLCFLPWAYLVVAAALRKEGLAGNLGWLDKPHLADIFLFFAEIQGTLPIQKATTVGFLIFLPPVLLWIHRIARERNSEHLFIFTFLSLISVLPVIVAFALSQFLKISVWGDRYLIAVAVPYTLLLAVSLNRINIPRLKPVFLTVAVCWTLGAGAWNVSHCRKRVDWISLSRRIAQTETSASEPVKIFVPEDWLKTPLQNSLDDVQNGKFEVEKVGGIEEIAEKEFWFGYRQTTWNAPESVRQKFEERHCLIETEAADESFKETVNILLVKCSQ